MKALKYIYYFLLGAWRLIRKTTKIKKKKIDKFLDAKPGSINYRSPVSQFSTTPVIIHKIQQMELAHKKAHPNKALEIEITFDELKDLFMSVEVTSSYYYIIKSILQGDVKSFLYGSTKITLSKFPDVITEQLK